MLGALTGAEAATIVNNNAAATVIALNTLAAGREAILSRGELVEIGGSFRMPEVFESAGVTLREVGDDQPDADLGDYARAINPMRPACCCAFIRVTTRSSASPSEPRHRRARRVGPGSTASRSWTTWGPAPSFPFPPEPVDRARASRAGADVITCSGDKLIGGFAVPA